jgi:hypothetical protein
MSKEVLDAVEALLLEPLETLAGLLEAGGVDGDKAGALLALVVAGARAELAGQVTA